MASIFQHYENAKHLLARARANYEDDCVLMAQNQIVQMEEERAAAGATYDDLFTYPREVETLASGRKVA